LQCRRNCLEHTIPVCHHVVIIEAQDTKTLVSEITVAACVALLLVRLKMLTAVQFDNQLCLMAEEINDVGAHRRLPSEACATEPVSAQRGPQPTLRLRQIVP
jgi:hypothetical protein